MLFSDFGVSDTICSNCLLKKFRFKIISKIIIVYLIVILGFWAKKLQELKLTKYAQTKRKMRNLNVV